MPCRGFVAAVRAVGQHFGCDSWATTAMNLQSDDFLRLESLVYRRISPRPDWLKAWRNEANYILFCARRADDADDVELLEELEDQARDMADMIEGRLRAEGLE